MGYSRDIAEGHREDRISLQATRRAKAHDLIVGLLNEAIEIAAESRAIGIEIDADDHIPDALHGWLTANPAEIDDEADPIGGDDCNGRFDR